MSDKSGIQWTDATWNPVRGCTKVSAGCKNCYAETFSERWRGIPGHPFKQGFDLRIVPEKLDQPLRWKRGRRIFVNSMSDLFHEDVEFEYIAAVFGVMAACPQHTFQVLTKRPERALEFLTQATVAADVERFRVIALAGRIEEYFAPERTLPLVDFPGYFVTSKGRVLTDHGSQTCVYCGAATEGNARKKFCSDKCRSEAGYEKIMGRWKESRHEPTEIKPLEGEHGHQRVMLYRHGEARRPLVHRLVLLTFDGVDDPETVTRHLDGNASNNALWNILAGTQVENMEDSRRHGTARKWSKLTPEAVEEIRADGGATSLADLGRKYGVSATQIKNVLERKQWPEPRVPVWPLPSVHLGVSCENQETADQRITLLLQCPAAVRFVSAEPLLGPIDLAEWIERIDHCNGCGGEHPPQGPDFCPTCKPGPGLISTWGAEQADWYREGIRQPELPDHDGTRIHWIIAGGESGPGARPCDLAWVRSIVKQCKAAGVPVFVKQLGAGLSLHTDLGRGRHVRDSDKGTVFLIRDRKGGDMDEWPDDIKVREFPNER